MRNSKTIITYKPNIGQTEKYANWIAERFELQGCYWGTFSVLKILNYDIIIFGAGITNGIKFKLLSF